MHCSLESESQSGHHLRAIVFDVSSFEVNIVESIELALLSLILVGEVDVATSEAVASSEAETVSVAPVGEVGLSEGRVIADSAESIVAYGRRDIVVAEADGVGVDGLELHADLECVLRLERLLSLLVDIAEIAAVDTFHLAVVGCAEVAVLIFSSDGEGRTHGVSETDTELPRSAEIVFVLVVEALGVELIVDEELRAIAVNHAVPCGRVNADTHAEGTVNEGAEYEAELDIEAFGSGRVPVGQVVDGAVDPYLLIEGLASVVCCVDSDRGAEEDAVADVEREVDVHLVVISSLSFLIVSRLRWHSLVDYHVHLIVVCRVEVDVARTSRGTEESVAEESLCAVVGDMVVGLIKETTPAVVAFVYACTHVGHAAVVVICEGIGTEVSYLESLAKRIVEVLYVRDLIEEEVVLLVEVYSEVDKLHPSAGRRFDIEGNDSAYLVEGHSCRGLIHSLVISEEQAGSGSHVRASVECSASRVSAHNADISSEGTECASHGDESGCAVESASCESLRIVGVLCVGCHRKACDDGCEDV